MSEIAGSDNGVMAMKVKALYVYPIKSLRGIALTVATMTKHGFPYDRRFMLLRVKDQASQEYENMAVAHYASMCLFTTAIHLPSTEGLSSATVQVTYTDPSTGATSSLDIPLEPETAALDPLPVTMHQSSTTAFAMPARYSSWFTTHFGFPVVLAHIATDSYRPVLGNLAPNAAARNAHMRAQKDQQSSWLGALTGRAAALLPASVQSQVSSEAETSYEITFADCAPYLVVSQTSVEDAQRRLQSRDVLDVTKFRPNIVISGAPAAFDEDFWGELCFDSDSDDAEIKEGQGSLLCTANCSRCTSLNVDYATGTFDSKNGILKKLQADRRVDSGTPYSPCFGRYSFWTGKSAKEIRVGDVVRVGKRNESRTTFKWPGLGATKKDDLYPV